MRRRRAIPRGLRRGISLRQVAPNAVTAMALCFGLTGVRFAMSGQWEFAVASVILAGVLDGLDGRIARLLQGESRFGAELDSLSDCIAFGVSPAIIIYLVDRLYTAWEALLSNSPIARCDAATILS